MPARVVGTASRRRTLTWLNIFGLSTAYVALFTHASGASHSYQVALVAGAATILVVMRLTMVAEPGRLSKALGAFPAPITGALAVAPWLALSGLVLLKGLWWTQRPAVLRFFVEYAIANWSVLWCLAGPCAPHQ